MQERALGEAVDVAGLRRGDLVFWKGHVAIVRDPDMVVHAASFHMMVVLEPIADVVRRVMDEGNGPIRSVKRLPARLDSGVRQT
jgi:cell wall-associated NlpC family hydrolase